MTFILHHEAPTRFNIQALAMAIERVARISLAAGARFAIGVANTSANLPPAIGRAFAMAYTDPYQQTRDARDPADPRNF